MKASRWLFGIGGLALIAIGFARLETQMADNTQSILDAIDAEDAEIERIKNVIAGEFQALKDQIAGMDTVDKARILAAIDASKQKVTGVDPGAA
jgi:hypothetical protein